MSELPPLSPSLQSIIGFHAKALAMVEGEQFCSRFEAERERATCELAVRSLDSKSRSITRWIGAGFAIVTVAASFGIATGKVPWPVGFALAPAFILASFALRRAVSSRRLPKNQRSITDGARRLIDAAGDMSGDSSEELEVLRIEIAEMKLTLLRKKVNLERAAWNYMAAGFALLIPCGIVVGITVAK